VFFRQFYHLQNIHLHVILKRGVLRQEKRKMNTAVKESKASRLLRQYRSSMIEELGPTAFELLTPYETARELGIPSKRIPELNRQGWLEAAPHKDIGTAHQYYRWRVTFTKRFKTTYSKKNTA
jgi:hypothetical protein